MKIPPIPMEQALAFLIELLNTPSPTGNTQTAMAFVEQSVQSSRRPN